VALDNETQDTNNSTSDGSTLEGTTPAGAAAEQSATPPRRRATRSRTTKKAAAPQFADQAETGQLPFGDDPEAGSQAVAEAGPAFTDAGAESEVAAPAKRARAPRKRTAPRAAPRSAGQGSAGQGSAGQGLPLDVESSGAPDGPGADAGLIDALESAAGTEGGVTAAQTDTAVAADPAKKSSRRRSRKAVAPATDAEPFEHDPPVDDVNQDQVPDAPAALDETHGQATTATVRVPIMPLFQAPEPVAPRPRRAASRPAGPPKSPVAEQSPADEPISAAPAEDPADVELEIELDLEGSDDLVDDLVGDEIDVEDDEEEDESSELEGAAPRRRRRRGGRGRRGRGRTDGESAEAGEEDPTEESGPDDEQSPAIEAEAGSGDDDEEAGESSGSRRRRRRRRRGSSAGDSETGIEDSPNVVTKVREPRRDDVTAVRGSTRLEAKKQRRREGREAGKRRTILTEAEFLTRRESVERVMVVREREGRTQIGVLEDGLLVEHYVARKTQTSTVGNVYLGRVQNVLPSMEAAFVDIGKGRNAVLYAGEVNWDAAGLDGQPRRIEHALKAGEAVLVQVTKDPIGHKGARLTSQISMPGRYLVYVPDGSMTGISRKLPDTERSRLKKILREIVPDDAGVIVRTAAEGASDEELERDVARLRAQWEDISSKIKTVQAPAMLYGEPDLAIRVVRDIFNEDFGKLIVSGDDAWDTLQGYISHVAPDLAPRIERWTSDQDVFAAHRIDEQLAKALDRKVWLPSGGSLVIDRTEAMTVIDVNTGKFTGAGGNLEETVTKNNLEAAEEVVHQLRLRDIGGIIVVDFIDMVLESNRDLVLRRLLECLGRDRTRHQVAEVTSLGLVQMTRKRVGQGLLEVFSETCEHCGGRGLILHDEPVERKQQETAPGGGGGGTPRRGRNNH
jgi:ribonuclease E